MLATSTREKIKNKKEIDPSRFCVEFAILWQQFAPELRFMQFISNFQAWMGSDGFYMENGKTLEKLAEYCKTLKRY